MAHWVQDEAARSGLADLVEEVLLHLEAIGQTILDVVMLLLVVLLICQHGALLTQGASDHGAAAPGAALPAPCDPRLIPAEGSCILVQPLAPAAI